LCEQAGRRDFWSRAREVLTERQRQVFALQRLGFSTAEIAERLGLEPATVRALKAAAVRRLRQKVLHLFGPG
jgi:DNA-binding NarL/FixJ family response regulator